MRPDDATTPDTDNGTDPDPGTAADTTGPITGSPATGTGGGTAERIAALWVGSTAQIHGRGTGDYAGRVVRVVSDRGQRWTVETGDGTRLKIDPRSLRVTDQRFVSTVPVYVPGSVVTITPPVAVYPAEQRFAVIAVRATTLTVAKLGGDGGITYRVPPAACHPANPGA